MSILGTRVIRTEDPRLLTAGGVYVDDLRTPELDGAARVTFVRSPVAHARITGIDASAAFSEPGVVAVLTVQDMTDLAPPPPDDGSGGGGGEAPMPLGGPWSEPLLAVDTVRFVGEPVALVLTDGRYQGEDAADLVSVDYDPLPAVVGPRPRSRASRCCSPRPAPTSPLTKPGSADDAPFDGCEVVVEQDIVNQRVACVPLEGRATAAAWEDGKLTVWDSTQNAQLCRLILAAPWAGPGPDPGRRARRGRRLRRQDRHRPGRDRRRLGGQADRPALRWVETRSENLVGMTQGRAQLHHIKIGGNRDGQILAYRLDVVQDCGAYSRMGGFLPMLTSLMAPGVYDIPKVEAGYRVVVTNATPISAYRGAGRPEAAATIERAVDLFAAEIGMDPAEVGGATSSPRTSSRSRPRPGPRTTAASTPRPSTRCSPRPATTSCARSRRAGGQRRRAGSSASASPPTWRSPRPTAPPARPRSWRSRRRHRDRLHRQLPARPGPPHRLGDARQGGAGHPDGQGHRDPRRHRPGPGRRRHLRVPLAAARRLRRAQGGGRGQGRGAPRRPRRCSRRPRPTWSWTPRAACGRSAATRRPR